MRIFLLQHGPPPHPSNTVSLLVFFGLHLPFIRIHVVSVFYMLSHTPSTSMPAASWHWLHYAVDLLRLTPHIPVPGICQQPQACLDNQEKARTLEDNLLARVSHSFTPHMGKNMHQELSSLMDARCSIFPFTLQSRFSNTTVLIMPLLPFPTDFPFVHHTTSLPSPPMKSYCSSEGSEH